jgi:hypothetical protein
MQTNPRALRCAFGALACTFLPIGACSSGSVDLTPSAGTTGGAGGDTSPLLVPAQGALLGAFVGMGVQAGSSWRPFPSLASTIYAGIAAKGKPVMIPETASAEAGGDKAAWAGERLVHEPLVESQSATFRTALWRSLNSR